MKVGTKSVLFGVHNPIIHGLTLAYAWNKIYGPPKDFRLWCAFFLHDIGYFGKVDMDGEDGSMHPELGAKIMGWLFGEDWYDFTVAHSGRYAKEFGLRVSKLYVVDKFAMMYTPKWLYLLLSNLSGEIHEYLCDWEWKGTQEEWFDKCSVSMAARAAEAMFLSEFS